MHCAVLYIDHAVQSLKTQGHSWNYFILSTYPTARSAPLPAAVVHPALSFHLSTPPSTPPHTRLTSLSPPTATGFDMRVVLGTSVLQRGSSCYCVRQTVTTRGIRETSVPLELVLIPLTFAVTDWSIKSSGNLSIGILYLLLLTTYLLFFSSCVFFLLLSTCAADWIRHKISFSISGRQSVGR